MAIVLSESIKVFHERGPMPYLLETLYRIASICPASYGSHPHTKLLQFNFSHQTDESTLFNVE